MAETTPQGSPSIPLPTSIGSSAISSSSSIIISAALSLSTTFATVTSGSARGASRTSSSIRSTYTPPPSNDSDANSNRSLIIGIIGGILSLVGCILFFYCCIKCGGWLGRREVAKWDRTQNIRDANETRGGSQLSKLWPVRARFGLGSKNEKGAMARTREDDSFQVLEPFSGSGSHSLETDNRRIHGVRDEFADLNSATTRTRTRMRPRSPLRRRDLDSDGLDMGIPFIRTRAGSNEPLATIRIDSSDEEEEDPERPRSMMERSRADYRAERRRMRTTLRAEAPGPAEPVSGRETAGEVLPPVYTETRGEDGEGLPRYGDESTTVVAAGAPIEREDDGLPRYGDGNGGEDGRQSSTPLLDPHDMTAATRRSP